jgi:hypothetical protein
MTAAYTFSRIDGLDTKFPKAFFNEEKYSFTISKELAYSLKHGIVYNIEWEEKEVTAKGKTWKQKVLVQALPQEYSAKATPATKTAASEPIKAVVEPSKGNGKYSQSEIEAFARKDLLMSRMSAEKASAECSLAYAQMCVASGCLTGLREEEIKGWLTAFRKSQYELILKEINL